MDRSINLQIKELQQKISKEIEESKLPSSILLLIFQNLTSQLDILNNTYIQQELSKMKESNEKNEEGR